MEKNASDWPSGENSGPTPSSEPGMNVGSNCWPRWKNIQAAYWFGRSGAGLSFNMHARAEAQAKRTIELFPDALQPHFVLGWAAWYQGRAEEAVAVLEKALSHSREALSLAYLGHVYGRLGRTEDGGAPSPRTRATSHARSGSADRVRDNLRGTRR